MATKKGTRVDKTITTFLVLKIQGPNAMMEFDPVNPENEAAVDALIETAEQYERGGVKYEIVRRETQIRTQTSDTELTIDQLKNPDNEGDEEPLE